MSFMTDDLIESFVQANKKYYITQKWSRSESDDYLSILLSDSTNFWTGAFTKSQVIAASNMIDFDLDGIKSQMIQAFTNASRSDFQVLLKHSDDYMDCSLTIKKLVDKDVRVEIINLALKIVDDPTSKIQETLDYCIHSIRTLKSSVDGLQAKNKLLESERSEALKTLEECVKQKEDLEFNMFSKFVHVLNAKKEKIRELTTQLSEE